MMMKNICCMNIGERATALRQRLPAAADSGACGLSCR
jgi:hypothetical protein